MGTNVGADDVDQGAAVAGDQALAAEFLEMIQPFRYPRLTSENVLDEVAVMKERIENEMVKAGELNRNVKLGRGGIREIEFTVQALQLLNGGRIPFLQIPQTLRSSKNLCNTSCFPKKPQNVGRRLSLPARH